MIMNTAIDRPIVDLIDELNAASGTRVLRCDHDEWPPLGAVSVCVPRLECAAAFVVVFRIWRLAAFVARGRRSRRRRTLRSRAGNSDPDGPPPHQRGRVALIARAEERGDYED
jgi:hypothetical protein